MGIAECLESLASLAAANRQPQRAARDLGAAEALRETMGAPLPRPECAEYDRTVTAIRAACGDKAFVAAWEAGRTMTIEQAVATALEESDEATD